jgi:parallel beta-helix repeat protein
MKKSANIALVLVSLVALGLVCVQPVKALDLSFITINADGTVDPSTAPIERADNVYTLASDFGGSISVLRSNMIIDGNRFTVGAVSVKGVSNVTVRNFTFTGCTPQEMWGAFVGILLTDTSNVTIVNNTISGVWDYVGGMNAGTYIGIYVKGGDSNIVTGNNLVNNLEGMLFFHTSYNVIVGNNITCGTNPGGVYCQPGGIFFNTASNNVIYHNNFRIDMGGEVAGLDSTNVWDDGYLFGGNYWSDYLTSNPEASEIGDSGIGDTSYVIDSANKDQYPLMMPFTTATYLLQTTPPVVSLQSPLSQTYNVSSVSLVFSVDKVAVWMGYCFDGEQNVTVTGNSTLVNMTDGLHRLAVYANDTFGNMGFSETSFTVAVPEVFPVVIVATVALAVTVLVIGVGLIVYFKKRHNH